MRFPTAVPIPTRRAFWCCAVLYFAPKGLNKSAQGNALGTGIPAENKENQP